VTFTLKKKLRKRKVRKHLRMMMRKELTKVMKSKKQKSMCST
jgi:hypothetical protein